MFFSQYCWVLGAIISTSTMALYIATDVFRASLKTVNKFEGSDETSSYIVRHWLSDQHFALSGLFFASVNIAAAISVFCTEVFANALKSLNSL